MSWAPAEFEIATPHGLQMKAGYTYRGLGLWIFHRGSPKGRRPAVWNLTHLGSGHLIVALYGNVATAFPIASEIAEAGDWTFDGLTGWKNQFPDAGERLREILEPHSKRALRIGGKGDEAQAMAIAANRAGA